MNQVFTNPSVAKLMKTLLEYLQKNGFAVSAAEKTSGYARHLSHFMEQNIIQTYDESVGLRFLNDICQHRAVQTRNSLKLFIARMNAIHQGEGVVTHIQMSKSEELPVGLENLISRYKEHCFEAGLQFITILGYEKRCRMFLKLLADDNVNDSSGMYLRLLSAFRTKATTPQFIHFYAFYPKAIIQIETTLLSPRPANLRSQYLRSTP